MKTILTFNFSQIIFRHLGKMLKNALPEAIFRDRKINKCLLLFLYTLLCHTA